MDTTAAAELGLAMAGPGVDGIGFWDNAHSPQETWPEEDYEPAGSFKAPGRRSHARQGRPPLSASEPIQKRIRTNIPNTIPGDQLIEDPCVGYGNFPQEDPVYDAGYGGAGSYTKVISNGLPDPFPVDYNSGLGHAQISGSNPGKGKGTGSIFFKTKLCSKFKAGTCPYNSNCNFAHGMEELRKPPPGWEEIVAAQEAERASRGVREGQSQPVFSNQGSAGTSDAQRFHKTRPCKKYYTDEGCPYGDRCNFLHDDQASQARTMRESNAISLGPTVHSGNTTAGTGPNLSERSNNWKTKICNKWETTGHCPFGQKCHFAHGVADGHAPSANPRHMVVASSLQTQRQAVKTTLPWKGPVDEISTIYGDWIEDDEWEHVTPSVKKSPVESDSHKTISTFPDVKKDDSANQGQKTKQQISQQQPKIPFFRGTNGYNNLGKNQKSGFSVMMDGKSQLHESTDEQSFHDDGGLYADDDWDTEL